MIIGCLVAYGVVSVATFLFLWASLHVGRGEGEL